MLSHPPLCPRFHFCAKLGLSLLSILVLTACARPKSGPDQVAVGGLTGAAIGAGAGAVIGNQVNNTGPGAAVGAGFGALAGALTGWGQDRLEETQVETKRDLDSIRAQTAFNRAQLMAIQSDFDTDATSALPLQSYQVYFDDNATNLRSGSIAELEGIAENIKTSRAAVKIEVIGHTDDTGNPTYNMQLSEARARNVASYLQARGISVDRFDIKAFGSTRPVATNGSAVGRQLNRRVEVRLSK